MTPSLLELNVIPSFCFAFKIPDDVTATIMYLQDSSLPNIYSEFAPDNNNVVHVPGCILSNCYRLQYQSKSKITVPRSWNYKREPCWFTLQTILQRNGPKSYNRWTRIYLQHSYFRGNVDKILAFFDHLLTYPKTLHWWKNSFTVKRENLHIFDVSTCT